MRYRSQTFLSAMFNDQGVVRPLLQPVTHDMLADDHFMTAKMDHIELKVVHRLMSILFLINRLNRYKFQCLITQSGVEQDYP